MRRRMSYLHKIFNFVDRNAIFFDFGLAFICFGTLLIPSFASGSLPGLIYRGIVLALIILFAIILCVENKLKNFVLFICITIYGISNILIVSFIQWTNIGNGDIISIITRLSGIAQILGIIAIALISFIIIKKKNPQWQLHICLAMTLLFSLISAIYALCFQFDVIVNSFFAEHATLYQVTSFFSDKNAFGCLLMIGIIVAFFLAELSKKSRYYLFIIPLGLLLIISRAKIAILLCSLFGLSLLIYKCIANWKKHRIAAITCFSLLIVIIAFLVVFLLIPEMHQSGIAYQIYYYITHTFINDGMTTIIERFEKWNDIASLFSSPLIITGYGERTSLFVIDALRGYKTADNVYISTLLEGGLIKLILYFAFMLYFIYYAIKSMKKKEYLVFFLSFIGLMLIYGFFEDVSFLSTSALSMVICSLLVVLPNSFQSYENTLLR